MSSSTIEKQHPKHSKNEENLTSLEEAAVTACFQGALLTYLVNIFLEQSGTTLALIYGTASSMLLIVFHIYYESEAGQAWLMSKNLEEKKDAEKREAKSKQREKENSEFLVLMEMKRKKLETSKRLNLQRRISDGALVKLNLSLHEYTFKLQSGDYAGTAYVTRHGIMFPLEKDGAGFDYGKRYTFADAAQFEVTSDVVASVGIGKIRAPKRVYFTLMFSDGKRVLGEISQRHYQLIRFALNPGMPRKTMNASC